MRGGRNVDLDGVCVLPLRSLSHLFVPRMRKESSAPSAFLLVEYKSFSRPKGLWVWDPAAAPRGQGVTVDPPRRQVYCLACALVPVIARHGLAQKAIPNPDGMGWRFLLAKLVPHKPGSNAMFEPFARAALTALGGPDGRCAQRVCAQRWTMIPSAPPFWIDNPHHSAANRHHPTHPPPARLI